MEQRKRRNQRRSAPKSTGEFLNVLLLLAVMAALWAVFSSEPNGIQAAILNLEIFSDTEDILEQLKEILGWSFPNPKP